MAPCLAIIYTEHVGETIAVLFVAKENTPLSAANVLHREAAQTEALEVGGELGLQIVGTQEHPLLILVHLIDGHEIDLPKQRILNYGC